MTAAEFRARATQLLAELERSEAGRVVAAVIAYGRRASAGSEPR